ncbi:sigma-70 family RNA polymerase sigma factor [Streptomonospora halophila]|uniref:Sigma-70 family RNA polymerase sigma factor n=1 Tax=Streptomonospora halophila TaxID=427369 RepID=A0ABP9GMD5_9ACTN
MSTTTHAHPAEGRPQRTASAAERTPARQQGARPPGRRLRGREPLTEQRITDLALAAQNHTPDAVETFVRATRGDVWRLVAYLSDPQTADDLTQETFVRALRSLAGYAGRSSARIWLMSIARRTVADHYRAAAVRPRAARSDGSEQAADAALPHRPSFEEELALDDLVNGLPEPRRTAFVLTQLQGFTYEAAAAATGVPIGTVRSRVARARGDLVAVLRRSESDAG